MSTTFGICKIDFQLDEYGDIPQEYINEEFVEVAFRGNGGWFRFNTQTAEFLPDSTKVYPLDNTAQGIFTIGDIKREIDEQRATTKRNQRCI